MRYAAHELLKVTKEDPSGDPAVIEKALQKGSRSLEGGRPGGRQSGGCYAEDDAEFGPGQLLADVDGRALAPSQMGQGGTGSISRRIASWR